MSGDPPVTLRKAAPADQETIKRMVRAAGLDPSALHWSHFVIAEMAGESVVGIGQIRPYRNCPELGSLVVRKPFRDRGIGGMIIQELIAHHPPPVYLECRSQMAAYYTRFGFSEIPWPQAPMPLKLKAGVGNLLGRLVGMRVAVMRWDGPAQAADETPEDQAARAGAGGV